MGEELVIVRDLWKVYRSRSGEYPALRGVNMVVREGELLAVVGPSGSGKSTLLHIIGGLDRPTKGEVIVAGIELSRLGSNELSKYRNEYVGFVFQFYNLIPYLTALENVELPLAIAGVPKDARVRRALELLELVGLKGKEGKRAYELSGGEQQRVAIARALATKPKLVLADEPTGNLDSRAGEVVMKLFRELVDSEGVTVVLVTHNLSNLRYADRAYWLRDGVIVRESLLKGGSA